MTYDLQGTPCANVSSQGICIYRSDVQALFPDDHLLVEMNAQSYFGVPLKDKSDQTLGILVLLDDKPLVNIPLARDLLQVFASRAAAELSRMKAEHDLHHREAFEMLLSSVSTHFMELPPEKTDEGIMSTLQALGEFSELDRVYLFEFADQMTSINNTHEWCATEISNEIDNLQGIPCKELPWAMAPILRNETLYVPSVAKIPKAGQLEKEHWQEQGILSLVCVPVLIAGELHGFLGFDSVKKVRLWDEKDLKLLKTFAEVIGNALEHQKHASILYDTFREAEADRNNITAILNSVADALIVTDTNKQVLLMNHAAERLLDDTLPKSCNNQLGVSSVLTKLKNALSDGLPKKPFDIEIATDDNDRPLTLQARVAETKDATGARTGQVISLRDVTREREIDRMKSEFISTAAHELNTPLSAIMGYTEMLLEEKEYGGFTKERKLDFLAEIYRRSEALSFIIDDLLDISRIDRGRPISLNLKECNAEELLTKAVDYYRIHDTKHDYQLILPKEQDRSSIIIDYHRINQVLENLLSNASKYSPEGEKITVCGTVSANEWEVMVKDQGIGMNKVQVERIFDKFFRANSSDTAVGGLGLGMSIALQIVKAHGGKISINSKEKRGTTVTLKIPKRPTTPSPGDEALAPHPHSTPPRSTHH
jgi:signal transduction histidine kinase